jgi:hypothetical protein
MKRISALIIGLMVAGSLFARRPEGVSITVCF